MSGQEAMQTGTLGMALSHAADLLATDPSLARAQLDEILTAVPGHPQALMLLGSALRRQGDLAAAQAVLAPLARAQLRAPQVHVEYAYLLSALGERAGAITALRHVLSLKPQQPDIWRLLGDLCILTDNPSAADSAYAQSVRWATHDPQLMAAATALADEKLAVAEALLKDRLKAAPTDVAAIRMLAEVAGRLGRYGDAENLLRRALELAPNFAAARHNLAIVLYRQVRLDEALAEVDALLEDAPDDVNYRNLKAGALARLGDVEQSISLYAKMLADHPRQPKGWLSYGHALKTAGRRDDGVEAYRKAIALQPGFGDAWWSLANLKTFRFTTADIAAMQAQAGRTDLDIEDLFHLHFALGKALEDEKAFEASFGHYAQGAKLRRSLLHYDATETAEHRARSEAHFTHAFFAERKAYGWTSPDPIFVVGLPRSGSTLIEQILDCHSAVEGTAELAELGAIARTLSQKKRRSETSLYPEVTQDLTAERCAELGALYLERTRVQRRTDKPLFIDKLPNNFLHVGLIQMILPNAKIIDARRHPMATCFSAFKQHFARGQNFSYDLEDTGRYYADYVRLMDHFDRVLPGRVHRVIYENMVDDTEAEVRRLLDYCGLPFEDACLRFYENDRAVRTASSEQVRSPIFRDGVDHWRNYEPWLDPLKTALGEVLRAYPGVPDFQNQPDRA